MSGETKEYYRITDLTKDFEVYRLNEVLPAKELPLVNNLQIWNIRATLAVAQQLSIVAKHLGKIVGKAEERNGKD